jgi:hypothetical protein
MRSVRIDLLLSTLLFAIGCGSGGNGGGGGGGSTASTTPSEVDISGWYQVTSDLEGDCGATKPFSLAPAYVWVERLQSTFYIRPCTGTTTADCKGTLFYDFTQPMENGWSAEGGSAFFSAGCTLKIERTQATLVGNELHVQALTASINKNIPESDCNMAAARALTQPCTYEVDLIATRL